MNNPEEPIIVSSLAYPKSWQALYVDQENRQHFTKFGKLVSYTVHYLPDSLKTFDWMQNTNEVVYRWKQLIEGLGRAAITYEHPSFDEARTGISLLRNSIDLATNTIECRGMETPALAISFDKVAADPSPILFDLRAMDGLARIRQ